MINGDGQVGVREVELPALQMNEVAIKVRASLISPGTEMGAVRGYRAKPDPAAAPMPFGYACVGEVLEIKGDGRGLHPGMRVAAMGAGKALHADYVNVPINLVVPIPDSLHYEEAVYACLGATALQTVRRAEPQLSDYGLVLGMGIVGNLTMQLSRLSGARMMAWEGLAGRRRIGAACGLTDIIEPGEAAVKYAQKFAAPYGMDFAVFAFGGDATPAFEQVKEVMKLSADGHRMGRIVLVGGCKVCIDGGAASGNLDIVAASRTGAGYHDPQWELGADYPNAFVQYTTQRNLREIVRLIDEKRLVVAPLTTHRMPLREVGRAADLLVDQPDLAMGIVLEMN